MLKNTKTYQGRGNEIQYELMRYSRIGRFAGVVTSYRTASKQIRDCDQNKMATT